MTRRERLLESFDDYVVTLRILSRRFLGHDRIADLPALLAPDWRSVENWHNALWLFEIEGVRATRYPGVLDNGATAEYTTPRKFHRLAANLQFRLPHLNRTPWAMQWPRITDEELELDPRYVAFRTMHDWTVLNAKLLTENVDSGEDVHLDFERGGSAERVHPFEVELPLEGQGDDDEPVGLICGNPRDRLVGGRFGHEWDSAFAVPDWQDVKRPWAAMRYFYARGLRLMEDLRYRKVHPVPDPRLEKSALLSPEVFLAYVTAVLAHGDDALIERWRSRPLLEVERDPRFIAHKCGFDLPMTLRIAREAAKRVEPDAERPAGADAWAAAEKMYFGE